MAHFAFYKYLEFDGERFFTVVMLPDKEGKFPIVIRRSPYVSALKEKTEEEITAQYLSADAEWLSRGYAVVSQHTKGQGKSTGGFVPYVHEREDGLFLRDWIRKQPFYNGELYLAGASYTASLHYETAPFEDDVKGAVFEVQDSERYRLWYRNGQMRKGHANWHFSLYKENLNLHKTHGIKSFSHLPLKNLSSMVLGEEAQDFEQMLEAERPEHPFWQTRFGGVNTKDALVGANIPILLTTGYNDFYVGGVFEMWNRLDSSTKKQSALLVSPYNHGDGYNAQNGVAFENGKRGEAFGTRYQMDWFDHIRKGTKIPFEKGVVTYYRTFENRWETDFYKIPVKDMKIVLGDGEKAFEYDPKNPPAFAAEGTFQNPPDVRSDIISVYTKPFEKDLFIKGKMRVELSLLTNCDDTSFYVNISIKKNEGDYTLRHDITSLLYSFSDYKPNTKVSLEFCFDEYAFLLKKGEVLRVYISSTDNNSYVCHTNNKGPYYLQTDTKKAQNKVYLGESFLYLPVEE